mmetsp:Transcript_16956/g.23594  ORF Transcript_16956/g.23594 Transcript_16956/m.23594 type:complete len:336 (+) Transcript_16956:77-1084(+)
MNIIKRQFSKGPESDQSLNVNEPQGEISKVAFKSNHGYEWVDVRVTSRNFQFTRSKMKDIALEYNIHKKTVKDCLSKNNLPKLDTVDGTILVVSRYYNDENENEDADTVQELTNKIIFFVTDSVLLTIHRADPSFVSKVRENWDKDFVGFEKDHLLNYFLDRILLSYDEPIKSANSELDLQETKMLQTKNSKIVERLYHIKRRASVFKKMLDQMSTIITGYSKMAGSESAPYIQDLLDQAKALVFAADEVHENSVNLLNLYISLASHRTNELMTVLTIFSVFFTPLTFLAGIYGMNFEYMPELERPGGYPVLLLAMLVITGVIYYAMRKKGFLHN